MPKKIPAPQQSSYLCKFDDAERSHLIEVKVTAYAGQRQEGIRDTIARVVEEALHNDRFIASKKKQVSIELKDGARSFKILSDASRPASELDDVDLEDIRPFIKISKVAEQRFPKRTRQIREIIDSLLQCWPRKVPLVALIWKLAVYPLSVLMRVVYPGKIYDTSSLAFKEDPHSQRTLEDAIEEVVSVMDGQENVSESLKQGLDFARRWRVKGTNKIILSSEMAGKVMDLEEGQALPLPGGYWNKGVYEPVLWSFQKDEEGKLTLLEMAYGIKDGETIASYKFADADQEKVRALLYTLFTLSEKPASLSDLKLEPVLGEFYLQGLNKLDFAPRGGSSMPALPSGDQLSGGDMLKFKRSLITAAGCELVERAATRDIIRDDPLKIVQESIRTLFPEAAFSDKAFFSLHIFHSRLSKITKALPFLKGEQRKYWLNRLDAEYKGLERQMEKAQIGEGTIDSWDSLSSDVALLREAVEAMKVAELSAQSNRLGRLNKVKAEKLALTVDTGAVVPIDAPSTQRSERLSAADYAKVEELKRLTREVADGDAAKVDELSQSLDSLNKRVNELLDGRHYEAAQMLCHAIMPLVPLPSSGLEPEGIWAVLQNTDGMETVDALRVRSEQIKTFSERWAKLSHYFWETKIQTRNLKMKPDESVHMLSITAALFLLMNNRKAVIERLQAVDAAAMTYEEEAFLAVAPATDPHWFDRSVELQEEKYLRHSENPLVAEKLQAVRRYFTAYAASAFPNSSRGVFELRSDSNDQEIGSKLLEVAERRRMSIPSGLDKKKLRLSLLDETKPEGQIFFPSVYSDLARHDLMFASLLHSNRSMAMGMFGVGGFIKAGVFAFQQEVVHKGQRDQSKKLVSDALEQLANQRLEIRPAKFFSDVYFAVVPRGTAPGKKANVEISARAAQLQLGNKNLKSEDANAQELGNPSSLYEKRTTNEMRALGEAMASDSPNPVEDFFLSVMDLRREVTRATYSGGMFSYSHYWGGSSQAVEKHGMPVHEVFDLILQRPWLLDTLSKNREGKPSREAQKRFYDRLFAPDLLTNAIKEGPEFFQSHAAPLRDLLEKTRREKKTEQYLFLLYLLQTVNSHLAKAAEQPDADPAITALADVWPNITAEPGLLERAFELWNEETDLNVKVDGAAYITSLFSNSLQSMEPEDIPQLQESGVVAKLLQLGGLLGVAKYAGTMPVLPIQAHSWIREVVAPYLDQKCEDRLDVILDKWVAAQVGPIGDGAWRRVDGSPMQWEKEGTRVDLGSLHIVKYNNIEQEGFQMALPGEVLAHPDYIQLFGSRNFTASFKAAQNAGEFSYAFKSSQPGGDEHSYRLLYNASACTLKIERLITVQQKKRQVQRWHQLVRPKMPAEAKGSTMKDRKIGWATKLVGMFSDSAKDGQAALEGSAERKGAGIEQCLQRCGLWLDLSDKTKGVAFLGAGDGIDASTMRFDVSLNKKGAVQEVISAKNNMKVVANNDRELSRVISSLPEDQIIFLRQKGKRSINEIHFVGQKVYLSRQSPKHPWLLRGDKRLEGAKWVMGSERGGVANARLQALGLHVEDVGLTVRKGGVTTFLVWPQAATAPASVRVHPHLSLSFKDKVRHAGSPLKIDIDDSGRVLSTAAGYLELAYLFAVRHEYAKAALYLEKARHGKIKGEKEQKRFIDLQEHFKALPAHSCRSAAIKLKGLLAIRQVQMEQTNTLQFEPGQWRQFLSSAQVIDEAFNAYRSLLKRSPFAEKEAYFQRDDLDISLNAQELDELAHISNEALGFMVQRSQPVEERNATGRKVSFSIPTDSELQSAISSLVIAREKPLKDPQWLLDNLQVNEEVLVGHFFELYNLIVDNKLTTWDLRVLFGPVQGAKDMEDSFKGDGIAQTISSAQKSALVDNARRILLAVAASQQEGGQQYTRYDLGKIGQIQKKIPGGIITFALKTAWALFNAKRYRDKSNTSQRKLLSELNALVPDFSSLDRQMEIRLSGFTPRAPAAASLEKLIGKGEANVDVDGLRRALAADGDLFGPALSPLVAPLAAAAPSATDAKVPVELFVEELEKQTTINALEAVREREVSARIRQLEERALARVAGESPEADAQVVYELESLRNATDGTPLQAGSDALWKSAETTTAHLDAVVDDFVQAGCELENIDEVADALREKLADRHTIAIDQLPTLKSAIADQKALADERCGSAKSSLLRYVRGLPDGNNLPRNIQLALKRPDDFSDEEVLHLLTQAYQSMELGDAQASKLLTTYLFERAAAQVLGGEVAKHIQVLDSLSKQGVDDKNTEWVYAVTETRRLVLQSLNFKRHLDGAGRMIDPRLRRKALVCEAAKGIVITAEQLDLIAKMAENPTDWYELKVGAGKTSVVFPIVLMLLIEQGKFPTAVVKDELMQQNLDSLDGSTRSLIQRAGVEFTFSINDMTTPLSVQEQYLKLLQIEDNKGYPITSVSSIIAIDHKMQLLTEELAKKVVPLFEGANAPSNADAHGRVHGNKEQAERMQKIDSLQKQLHYLGLVRKKLSLLIIDEADDILNIVCENNVGRGEPVALNVTLQQTMEHVMRVIHTSDESDYPTIATLRNALKNGQQVSLPAAWVKDELMPELAYALLEDSSYIDYIGGTDDIDMDNLVDHLCTVFNEDEPPAPPACGSADTKKLGALKHILQSTLRIALRQNPGIDVGTKLSDGFQIGPQASGQEKIGTIFGDEYDLVVNHYLFYSLRLPEPVAGQKRGESFAEVGLSRIRDQNPDKYEEWVAEAGGEELVSYINRPENFQHRLDFLRLQLFDERRLKRYQRQIVINRQHIGYGRQIGGMTGTLNKDAMPRLGNEEVGGGTAAQKVSTQVILEAGTLEIPNVRVVGDLEDDVLDQMRACARNLRNKAIINQGFDLKRGQTRAVIESIRQGAPERIYVFVDSADRDFYIWHPGQTTPKNVSKYKLDELYLNKEFREKACFFFSPPDTRGTDFKIPPGKGACFVSSKCSKDDFVQALGRMRKAPYIHAMNFYVPTGLHRAIVGDAEDRSLSYASLVRNIYGQAEEEQEGKNLKSVVEAMKGVVNMGTRDILFGHQPYMDLPAYRNPSSPQLRLLNAYASSKLAQTAMDPRTGWLEDEKRVNLEADFEQSVMEDTEEYIQAVYQAEMRKVGRLEREIQALSAQGQAMALLGGGEIDNEALAMMQARTADLQRAIDAMKLALGESLRLFQADSGREIYPQRMPNSGANIPTGQAQVQEVVQQQQQTQQIQMKSATVPSDRYDSYYQPHDMDSLRTALADKSHDPDALNSLAAIQFPEVVISDNFVNIFADLDGIRGKLSFCRLMVVNDEVVLVSRKDYKEILDWKDEGRLSAWRLLRGSHFSDDLEQAGIYALTSPSVCGASVLLDKKLTEAEPQMNARLLKKIVEAKWLLGMSEFTDDELGCLVERFDAIKDDPARMEREMKFCERFGTPEQLALIADIVR